MKGYRFYAEMPEGRRSKGASKAWPWPHTVGGLEARLKEGGAANCVAVILPLQHIRGGNGVEAVAAAYDHENSAVCMTAADLKYLRDQCVRVPEALARKLHSNLFKYLEA